MGLLSVMDALYAPLVSLPIIMSFWHAAEYTHPHSAKFMDNILMDWALQIFTETNFTDRRFQSRSHIHFVAAMCTISAVIVQQYHAHLLASISKFFAQGQGWTSLSFIHWSSSTTHLTSLLVHYQVESPVSLKVEGTHENGPVDLLWNRGIDPCCSWPPQESAAVD